MRLRTSLFAGALLWAAATAAQPCDAVCAEPTPEQMLATHQYVMIGRVKAARWRDQMNGTFTIAAIRVWKGDKKRIVLRTTQGGTSTCGYSMNQNAVYVVYADADPQAIAVCQFAPIPAFYATSLIKALDQAKGLPPLSLSRADLKPPK
jgi:anaerobic glycerol-3-phosphate dehydrogenase